MAGRCQWIEGEPDRGAYSFCGKPVLKRSYCAEHYARCYVKPKPLDQVTPVAWNFGPQRTGANG